MLLSRLSLGFTFALALAACADNKPAQAPVAQTGSQAAQPTTAATVATNTNSGSDPNSGSIRISDEIRKACGINDDEAFFSFDSSHLRAQDLSPLNKIATCFTTGPLKGRGLRLVGHADPRGPEEYNMLLGHRRADSVGEYLDVRGMAKAKTETTSRGASDATGTDETGWAKDRRVDVLLGQ